MATRHIPRAPSSPATIAIVIGVVAAAGVVVGAAGHVIARAAQLVLLLPAAEGLAVGFATARAVTRFRLAAPTIAVAIAVGGVAVAELTHAYLDHHAERRALADEMQRLHEVMGATGALDDDGEAYEFHTRNDRRLDAMTFGYFLQRRYGLVRDTGHPVRGRLTDALGPVAATAVSVLELVVAFALAALWARASAREPFCPRCGRWCVEHMLGRAAIGVTDDVTGALVAGDVDAATAALRPPDTREELRISHMACPDREDHDGVLRLAEHRIERRGRQLRRHRVIDLRCTRAEIDAIRGRLQEDA